MTISLTAFFVGHVDNLNAISLDIIERDVYHMYWDMDMYIYMVRTASRAFIGGRWGGGINIFRTRIHDYTPPPSFNVPARVYIKSKYTHVER